MSETCRSAGIIWSHWGEWIRDEEWQQKIIQLVSRMQANNETEMELKVGRIQRRYHPCFKCKRWNYMYIGEELDNGGDGIDEGLFKRAPYHKCPNCYGGLFIRISFQYCPNCQSFNAQVMSNSFPPTPSMVKRYLLSQSDFISNGKGGPCPECNLPLHKFKVNDHYSDSGFEFITLDYEANICPNPDCYWEEPYSWESHAQLSNT